MRRLALLLVIAGCVTPSIPIPPPDPAKMTFHVMTVGTDSTAVFSYPPEHNYHGGIAYVYNRDRGLGVIVDVNADDSIGPTPAFAAAVNDQVVVSVQSGQETESVCVRLRDGTGQDANSCN